MVVVVVVEVVVGILDTHRVHEVVVKQSSQKGKIFITILNTFIFSDSISEDSKQLVSEI